MADEKIINKIKGLFALANDARGNQHQSEAALAKAYELLARHKLDKSEVVDFVRADETYIKGEGLAFEGRVPTEWHYISGIIEEFFNVSAVREFRSANYTNTVTKTGKHRIKGSDGVIWFIGKESDIAIAKVIYNQLYFQYKHLWNEYRSKFYAPTKDKRNYYQGLLVGMFNRLNAEKKKIENELALVIVKDPKIEEAKQGMFENLTTKAIASFEDNERIRSAGYRDSAKIRLNQAVTAGDNSIKLLGIN